MRKVLINQMEKIGEFAKMVAVESQNTSSYFLYYEPKVPKGSDSKDSKIV